MPTPRRARLVIAVVLGSVLLLLAAAGFFGALPYRVPYLGADSVVTLAATWLALVGTALIAWAWTRRRTTVGVLVAATAGQHLRGCRATPPHQAMRAGYAAGGFVLLGSARLLRVHQVRPLQTSDACVSRREALTRLVYRDRTVRQTPAAGRARARGT